MKNSQINNAPKKITNKPAIGAAALALALLISALQSRTGEAAPAHAGSSAAGFKAICALINLAAQKPAPAVLPAATVEEIEETLALINLTLMAPQAVEELGKQGKTPINWDKEGTAVKQHCGAEHRSKCEKAKKRASNHADAAVIAAARKLQKATGTAEAVHSIIVAINKALAEYSTQSKAAVDMSITSDLEQALGTKTDATAAVKLKGAQTDRATTCGNPGTNTKGKAAGVSLAVDIICLCGSDSTSGETNDACTLKTQTGNIDYASSEKDVKDEWDKLARECKEQYPQTPLTAKALRTALLTFDTEVAKSQGTNKNIINTLGYIAGAGTNGCDGSNGATHGACVYYGKDNAKKNPLQPAWRTHITNAIAKLQATEDATAKAHSAAARLETLNNTLTSLIFLGAVSSQKTHQATETATQSKSREIYAQEAAKKECEKANCKWKGWESETKVD
uniref:Variant surface glycoprotein 1125.1224 n=1 Tax=Trypanosoma brucei TaxID=5691 RepID=A0A1J0R6G8_9TRYP|nr:variant surface glycoprotein 1125.1224 [Trypanosoma brucei]